jgi:hypothetical protein
MTRLRIVSSAIRRTQLGPLPASFTHLDETGNPFPCPYCSKRLLSEGGRSQHIERSALCKAAHQWAMGEELERRRRIREGKQKQVMMEEGMFKYRW